VLFCTRNMKIRIVVAILLDPLDYLPPISYKIIWLSNDEGYSRNVSYSQNYISTFYFK
jgi:hypothetical protein